MIREIYFSIDVGNTSSQRRGACFSIQEPMQINAIPFVLVLLVIRGFVFLPVLQPHLVVPIMVQNTRLCSVLTTWPMVHGPWSEWMHQELLNSSCCLPPPSTTWPNGTGKAHVWSPSLSLLFSLTSAIKTEMRTWYGRALNFFLN